MADSKFLEWETKRFQRMMKAAQNWSGHGAISEIWEDGKPINAKKSSPSGKKATPTPAKARAQKPSSTPESIVSGSPGGSQNSIKRLLV